MEGSIHPDVYMFKVFGRRSEAFVERVRAIVAAHCGPVPLDSMKVRESARGRYVCVTILVAVRDRGQLERVYADLRADEQVLLYI